MTGPETKSECVVFSLRRLCTWMAGGLASLVLLTASVAGQDIATTRTTFADVAPILYEKCVSCHRPQGAAPFSLLTYADARQRARLIAQVTRTRVMPPWKSEPGFGAFIGQTHLSDAEINRLAQWASSDAPQGNAADVPPPPTFTEGWQLGHPSLVVSLPQPYTVPADGPDFSRIFVLRLPVSSPTFVNGFEFKPGGGGVVHHANIRVDSSPRSRALDEQDAELGYAGLLLPSAAFPDGHFLGWTPGQVAPLLPTGLSWRLNPGADLVVEMHFVPNGRVQAVQPSIALYFTNEPPRRTPAMLRLGRENLEIAPGDAQYVSTDSFVLPVDVEIQAVQPHAHYRARELNATARLPDGSSRPLVFIKDWDYRWQHVYRYVTPLTLPKGTTLALRYIFDNSAENPRNPQQPPQRVEWGQRSTDEMGDMWVQMLTRTESDRGVLNQALNAKHAAEEIVGYETMIRRDPTRVSLRNDAAVLYADRGEPDKAARHLDVVAQLQPDSAAAHYNLATALSALGRLQEAVEHYQHALGLRPDYALAHNNLGGVLLSVGRSDEARRHFEEAVRLDPQNAGAHANLAWILATARAETLRDAGRAVRLAERAAALTGRTDASMLDVLAAAYAADGQFDRAVTTCDQALALPPEPGLAAALRERRALYGQGRAYLAR